MATHGRNPYHDQVQGKANEPICVKGLLDRAGRTLGAAVYDGPTDAILDEIVDRLHANAPRIAVIGGSGDHPAHIADEIVAARAAARIWRKGGVPFDFSIPVLCDGTAQSNIGMSYSLVSRNLAAASVANQMEAHQYHGACVIQGCDKTPFGILCGLTLLDRVRRERGDAPVHATFAPSHVLRGGVIPADLARELEGLAEAARTAGHEDLARDLVETMRFILQSPGVQAFQGILSRMVQFGLMNAEEKERIENRLAARTCHPLGGVCAFYGTGNSSRLGMAALGMVHPSVELLVEPPGEERVALAVDALLSLVDRPDHSVSNVVTRNIRNAIRVHATTGGSTNLVMHLVAAMVYSGEGFDLWELDRIRREADIPDLFDYSLTEGRDVFELARQCSEGRIRGVETILHELVRNGVPVDLDAPTVTGTTWRDRLADERDLSASGVTENPIILSRPRRSVSGIDVLRGNVFSSAVVKVSGMPERQLDEFDEKVAIVLYYETEEEACEGLLDVHLVERLGRDPGIRAEDLRTLYRHNGGRGDPEALTKEEIWHRMVEEGLLRVAVVIAGQGPEAFGMPEMFTAMQHVNSNRAVRRAAVLLSDGRYSGTTYGAAIGHIVPEAIRRGGILYLDTGDWIHLRLRRREVTLLDPDAFRRGEIRPYKGSLPRDRSSLGESRMARLVARRRAIAPTSALSDLTDASRGVVPLSIARWNQGGDGEHAER